LGVNSGNQPVDQIKKENVMPWSNWKTEDIGIKVLGAPAISSWKEGRLDVFVHSTENKLYHRVYENDMWQGPNWVDLSDGNQIEVSPGVVSWGPNRIDLFAVWGKQVHHRGFQNGTWNPWTENLEGYTNDAPAAASGKMLRVDILVHTNDNHMSRRFWESGVTVGWQSWETIGGTSQSLMSAPAAVATAQNRIDCFGRGGTGHLIYTWYQGVIQDSWREIDTLSIKDAPAVVSGTTADRGRVDVFVRGADDLLKHRVYYTALLRPEPPSETVHIAVAGDYLLKIARQYNVTLDQLKALNPQITPPDYKVQPGDRIVVARQESWSLHSDWEPGSSWEDLSPNKIASAPAAVGWWSANVLKRIDCFAQDANNNLIHTWWK
jgi:LysM repeat protein